MTVRSELEHSISQILLRHWDPLGVREIPQAADEYDGHARQLAPWLHGGKATFHDVRKYLDDAAYSHSVSWDDDEALDRTARLLLELSPSNKGPV
jgi:hypothetical protein